MAFIDKEDPKPELGLDAQDETKDTVLTSLTAAVLNILDEKTGRTWATGTRTEYYDIEKHQKDVQLDNFPISSVTSVHDDPDWDFESGDLIDSGDYSFGDGKAGILHFDSELSEGRESLKVVYVAGYSDAAVPAGLKQLLIRQVCHWYLQGPSEGRYDLISKAAPQGAGTYSYMRLEGSLLPDFVEFIERNKLKP